MLQARYPRRLVVLGFPCNQFGYQVSPGGSRGAWQGQKAGAIRLLGESPRRGQRLKGFGYQASPRGPGGLKRRSSLVTR